MNIPQSDNAPTDCINFTAEDDDIEKSSSTITTKIQNLSISPRSITSTTDPFLPDLDKMEKTEKHENEHGSTNITSNIKLQQQQMARQECHNKLLKMRSNSIKEQRRASYKHQNYSQELRKSFSTHVSTRSMMLERRLLIPNDITKAIAILRFAVVFVWLAAACLVSFGVYRYTQDAQFKEFEIQYKVDAAKVLESFHSTIDKRLNAANTLATSLTIHAKYTNQTFPFVTMPDFVVPGSTARILADSAIIHWLPLITDEQREDWEEYAYQHREQVDEEFVKDEEFRREEDSRLGLANPEIRRYLEQLLEEEGEGEEEQFIRELEDGSSNSNTTNNGLETNISNNSSWIVNNVVQDGSEYHYSIWTAATNKIIPNGSGPYLPIWQRTPVNAARQATLNVDMANSRGLAGIFPYWSKNKPKGALLHRAIIPDPNVKSFHDQILFASQYRHHSGPYQNTPTTKLSYPVFDGFGQDAKFVGVLATTLYWRLSFTDIFHYNSARGLVCVVENSFGQIFSYRVDGRNATYLGNGDPLVNNTGFYFEDMMVTHSSEYDASPRPMEERLSYTTLPLDEDFGDYKIKIYPTQDTYQVYKKHEPITYTLIVASIFLLAAVIFLLYDFQVQKRQKAMMAKAIEQAHRAAVAERETAVAERELNEYLAHEVRNPLAAAISACSFVSSAVHEEKPLADEAAKEAVRDDVHIISSSLKFINDLLRNMLDLHRAVNHQVQIQTKTTDLYHDVLEPVVSMLYCRDDNFKIVLDCPKSLIIATDSLRLKQVILNLGRNAAKFVNKGFVRLRAEVISISKTVHTGEEGNTSPSSSVRIYVEDSGPGIPVEKRTALFGKFQQSLDLLSQGTGVGLCLCKQLVGVMGGDLWLDESYDSGIENCPGSRFVIDLNTSPIMAPVDEEIIDFEEVDQGIEEGQSSLSPVCISFSSCDGVAAYNIIDIEKGEQTIKDPVMCVSDRTAATKEECSTEGSQSLLMPSAAPVYDGDNNMDTDESKLVQKEDKLALPEELSVLFVDDDRVLRKLFSRSIKRCFPGWQVQEASSGEAAIQLVETECFDIIFMDQYMASTEKQLLGTETVRELRAQGVKSKICGLSANDVEKAFLSAGADRFIPKPIPCDKKVLEEELIELMYSQSG